MFDYRNGILQLQMQIAIQLELIFVRIQFFYFQLHFAIEWVILGDDFVQLAFGYLECLFKLADFASEHSIGFLKDVTFANLFLQTRKRKNLKILSTRIHFSRRGSHYVVFALRLLDLIIGDA